MTLDQVRPEANRKASQAETLRQEFLQQISSHQLELKKVPLLGDQGVIPVDSHGRGSEKRPWALASCHLFLMVLEWTHLKRYTVWVPRGFCRKRNRNGGWPGGREAPPELPAALAASARDASGLPAHGRGRCTLGIFWSIFLEKNIENRPESNLESRGNYFNSKFYGSLVFKGQLSFQELKGCHGVIETQRLEIQKEIQAEQWSVWREGDGLEGLREVFFF